MKPKKKSAKAKPTAKAKTLAKTGRPSKRTDEIVKRIIDGLSAGTPLTVICSPDGMPAPRTVSDWASNDKDLSACIARARDTGFDAIASRLRDTARGGGDSTGDCQRDKLIIDTDLKLLAKWDPKRYGDKIAQEISGPDGGAIKTETMTLTPDQESSLAQVIENARARVKK